MNRIITRLLANLLLACLLAACADARPDTIVSPRLDSGITSSNGGGMRALGDDPDVSITEPFRPAR